MRREYESEADRLAAEKAEAEKVERQRAERRRSADIRGVIRSTISEAWETLQRKRRG